MRLLRTRIISKSFRGLSEEEEETFQERMGKALETWDAVILGEIVDGRRTQSAKVSVLFRDNRYEETVPLPGCLIDRARFQIRIFKHRGRQLGGIPVSTVREYFRKFGGVHIFDAGFHLPYYGIEQDWLGVETDHAHRLQTSKLLPERLQVPRALNDLPTLQRQFGLVHVNTGRERAIAQKQKDSHSEFLKIQVTRDRLVGNKAYEQLKETVRWSLDYYATRFRLRAQEKEGTRRSTEPSGEKLNRVQRVLSESRDAIQNGAYKDLDRELKEYAKTVEQEARVAETQTALLAPLAAAGMAALAFAHETAREIERLKRIARRLKRLAGKKAVISDKLSSISQELYEWVHRVEASRRIFSPLTNVDDRERPARLRLRPTLDQVNSSLSIIMRDIKMDVSGVPADLRLPLGTMADWHALFQNVFTNAANALLDAEERRIVCTAGKRGKSRGWLKIQDTGAGVDLGNATSLFDPFERRLEISPERRALGLGGLGLGLTIVRMIAERRKCSVGFVEPDPLFATAFEMTWSVPRSASE